VGLKAHAFTGTANHRNRKGRMCRAYGARDSTTLFPRPAGRGYLLPRLWRSDRRVPILTRTPTADASTGMRRKRKSKKRPVEVRSGLATQRTVACFGVHRQECLCHKTLPAYSFVEERAALVERAGTHTASDRSPRLHLPWTLGALS
jgi:hypothetical protein